MVLTVLMISNGKTIVTIASYRQHAYADRPAHQPAKMVKVMHYIPMSLMFGSKPNEDNSVPRVVHDYWPWTNRTYDVEVNAVE